MFGLDPAPRYQQPKPPLVQAFGQVKFPARAKLATMAGMAPIQELLVPIHEPSTGTAGGAPAWSWGASAAGSPAAQVWQFDDAAGWNLNLSADTATPSVGPQYGEFGEFSTRFRAVPTALAEGAGVIRADCLGIRYVNIAEVPPQILRHGRGGSVRS